MVFFGKEALYMVVIIFDFRSAPKSEVWERSIYSSNICTGTLFGFNFWEAA